MASLRASVQKLARNYRTQLGQMSDLQKRIKAFNFNTSYYNQLGLIFHDIMPHSPPVAEAVKRLPREETEARDYRIARAFQLSATHSILPHDQWTKLEDDIPYLDPHIELVKKEWRDKADWDHFVNSESYP